MGQMGRGENFEFWIGHKLQACDSGDFVKAARNGTLEHDYDLVIGPKLKNTVGIEYGQEPKVLDKGTQIASEKAAKLTKCIN